MSADNLSWDRIMILNSKLVVALALLVQYSTVSALPLSSHTIERPSTPHSREIYSGEPVLVSRAIERRNPGSGFVSSNSIIQKQGSAKQTKFIPGPSPNRKVYAEKPSSQSAKDKNQPNSTIRGSSNKVYRPDSKANGPVVGRKSAMRPSRTSDKDCRGQRGCQRGQGKLSSNSKGEHKIPSGPLYAIGLGEMRYQEPNEDEQYDE